MARTRLLLCGALAFTLSACTVPTDQASAALDAAGLSSPKWTGYNGWACGRDDFYSSGFEATTVTGKRVRGVICSGGFKGATVRILGSA